MKCQVIGCDAEAEYYDEFSGHCGDTRRVRVKVCRNCIIEGWYIPQKGNERIDSINRILSDAEKIE